MKPRMREVVLYVMAVVIVAGIYYGAFLIGGWFVVGVVALVAFLLVWSLLRRRKE